MPFRRPKSLRELAEQAETYRQFGAGMRDFLHEFARAKSLNQPLAPLLAEEPPRLAGRFPEGNICDAFIAATADYLSRKNRIQSPPWSLFEDRVLEHPWFSEEMPEVRMFLLRDSPSAFKDKNLFVNESALAVA